MIFFFGCFRACEKEGMSPSMSESLRAIFAAFLWHEGLVHDAMACASFLKFHPNLPKQGALVVTRHNSQRYRVGYFFTCNYKNALISN